MYVSVVLHWESMIIGDWLNKIQCRKCCLGPFGSARPRRMPMRGSGPVFSGFNNSTTFWHLRMSCWEVKLYFGLRVTYLLLVRSHRRHAISHYELLVDDLSNDLCLGKEYHEKVNQFVWISGQVSYCSVFRVRDAVNAACEIFGASWIVA